MITTTGRRGRNSKAATPDQELFKGTMYGVQSNGPTCLCESGQSYWSQSSDCLDSDLIGGIVPRPRTLLWSLDKSLRFAKPPSNSCQDHVIPVQVRSELYCRACSRSATTEYTHRRYSIAFAHSPIAQVAYHSCQRPWQPIKSISPSPRPLSMPLELGLGSWTQDIWPKILRKWLQLCCFGGCTRGPGTE